MYLLEMGNKSRSNPEEASTENETSKIFDDVTTNNLVSFKKKNGITRIHNKFDNLGELRFKKRKMANQSI